MITARIVLVSFVLFVGVWQAVVWVTGVQKFILPGPFLVAEALWINRVLIAEHMWITIAEVLAGLVLGAVLGAATAIQLSSSSWAATYLRS